MATSARRSSTANHTRHGATGRSVVGRQAVGRVVAGKKAKAVVKLAKPAANKVAKPTGRKLGLPEFTGRLVGAEPDLSTRIKDIVRGD